MSNKNVELINAKLITYISLFCIMFILFGLCGCSDKKIKNLFTTNTPPDEFTISSNPPLDVPKVLIVQKPTDTTNHTNNKVDIQMNAAKLSESDKKLLKTSK